MCVSCSKVRADNLCSDLRACGPTVTFRAHVREWKVRRTGRSVKSLDEAAPAMAESHAVHFTGGPAGKIQQWLYFCAFDKTASFIHAFGKR